jgi:hypothetical protein
MKKMIKMSLIASVAVAGLTTTASATAMEDSIKNTDLSGYIRYRYTNGKASIEKNEYKTVFNIKSKVNDNVTAKLKVAGASATTNDSGDADPVQANIKEANFIFNLGGATVIAGKQGLATPFADAADQQGTGIVAVVPAGPVTVAAGWYTNSDAKAITDGTSSTSELTGNNIGALGVIGTAGPVNFAAWYAKISENEGAAANAGATAVNLNVAGKFGPVSVEFNHASVNYTGTTGDALKDPKQSRLVVSADAGVAKVTLGYVKTGKEGGNTTLGDDDAKSNFKLENISASATKDASIYYAGVKAPAGPVTVGLEYVGTGDIDGTTAAKTKANETKLSVAYAMSKNFTISAFATDGKTGTAENDTTRVEMKYTF